MAASYPTAVKTFTTKNADDTLQPADPNDLQDEVNAIEAGLLNGTARLNSSGSTLASMHVSGASTLAGDVGCTGTIGSSGARVKTLWVGQLDASSGAGVSPVAGRVFHSVAQEIPLDAYAGLIFNSQRFVSDTAIHSTATNSSRLVAPSVGGYLVGYTLGYSGGVNGDRTLTRLLLNDTTVLMIQGQDVDGDGTVMQHGQTVWRTTAANDFFTLQVRHRASTARISAQSNNSPEFYLARLST